MMRNPTWATLALLLLGSFSLAQETNPPRQKTTPGAGTVRTIPPPTTQVKSPGSSPTGQTPAETAPKPKPLHETLRGYLRQIKGVQLERADKDPKTIVTRYTSTTGKTFDIVVIHSPRKKMVGLYSYAFGNVAASKDANDLCTLLLSANEAMAFGSFFVDREQDIGLKWSLRTDPPITFETFQTVYLGLATAAKEYGPQIANHMKVKEGETDTTLPPPRNDEENRADGTVSPSVTRERRVRHPQ
ncbi:MAG: hypothetical protein ACUVR8_11395 [Acidobacteriota bacterium]